MSQNAPQRLYLMQVGLMPEYQIPIVCYLVQTEDGKNRQKPSHGEIPDNMCGSQGLAATRKGRSGVTDPLSGGLARIVSLIVTENWQSAECDSSPHP